MSVVSWTHVCNMVGEGVKATLWDWYISIPGAISLLPIYDTLSDIISDRHTHLIPSYRAIGNQFLFYISMIPIYSSDRVQNFVGKI